MSIQSVNQNSLKEQDTVFVAPMANQILFFDHITHIGGARTQPYKKSFALVGTGPKAFCVLVRKESLFDPVNLKVPTWTSFSSLVILRHSPSRPDTLSRTSIAKNGQQSMRKFLTGMGEAN